MAKTTEVKVKITGDSKSVVKATKRTESAFKKLGGFLKSSFVPLIAGGLGLRSLVNVFRSVTKAAAQQEDAVRSLDAALLPLGDAAAGLSKRLQEQAAALQKVTTAGDETIIKGQALIATFTKSEEEIKAATQAALDLSATVGVELSAAFLLMGKAAGGETSTLSRYNIIIEEGIPQGEKFAAVLAKIQEQMGGRAQEQAKTYAGVMGQIANAFSDLQEKVGASLTENKKVTDELQRLKQVLEDEGTVDSVERLSEKFVSVAVGAADAATAMLDAAQATDKINQAIEESDSKFAQQIRSIDAWAASLRDNAVEAIKGWAREVGTTLGLVNEWEGGITRVSMANQEMAGNMGTAVAALGSLQKATESLIIWQEREKRILKELTDSEDEFADATKRLGIVLESDVQEAIKKNNEALELYERRLKVGEISAEDYARAQLSIAQANKELRDSLLPATDDVQNLADAYDAAWPSIDLATAATDRFADSTRGSTNALRQAGEQLRSNNLIPSLAPGGRGDEESGFAQIGGGSFSVSGGPRPIGAGSFAGFTIGEQRGAFYGPVNTLLQDLERGGTLTFQGPSVVQDPDGRLRVA